MSDFETTGIPPVPIPAFRQGDCPHEQWSRESDGWMCLRCHVFTYTEPVAWHHGPLPPFVPTGCDCDAIDGDHAASCVIYVQSGRGPSQRQDALWDQMVDVLTWARENGCYDAYDWIASRFGGPLPSDKHAPEAPDA